MMKSLTLFKNTWIPALLIAGMQLNAGNNKPLKPQSRPVFKAAEQSQTATFTENKGQVLDQNNNPRPDVLFGGSANGLVFHLRKTGVSYQLSRTDSWKAENLGKSKTSKILSTTSDGKAVMVPDKSTIYRVDVEWLNSNSNALVLTDNALDGYANYTGKSSEKIQNVKTYKGFTYKNIYNNIDLHYYEKNGELKYDFIVAPHANYNQIQLQINGAKKIELLSDGSININTPLGNISEGEPLVYQEGKKLNANWIVTKNTLTLKIENYNPEKPLIIDPITRIWGTYYGQAGRDGLWGTTSDPTGNIYVVGQAGASTGTAVATSGAYQTSMAGGNYDALLAKFSNTGVRQWATYYGGTDDEKGMCISYAPTGHIYISGIATSTSGIATPTTVHQYTNGGGTYDAFLAKFTTSGAIVWSTYYGDAGDDLPWNCPVDASGSNIYLCGSTTSSTSAMTTSGSHQPTFGGGNDDAFLVKFNSAGVRQWATFYGGGGDETTAGAAIDPSGNIYLSGSTGSNATPSVIATAGGHQTVTAGGYDLFLVKFNSSGVRQWGTYYGDAAQELEGNCATDGLGNVYLCGITGSTLGISTSGSYQNFFYGGSSEAFLVKFNGSGVRQWATYYGGDDDEYGNIITCSTDASNNVYLTGTTSSTVGISTSGAYQVNNAGEYDGFFAKFNTSGSLVYATYYGGAAGELAKNTYIDPNGNIYMTGTTFTTTNVTSGSTSGIASPGAFKTTFGGDVDGYVVRFTDCNTISAPTNITSTSNRTVCSTRSATLSASSTASINWYSSNTSTFVLGSVGTYITNTLSTGNYTFYAGSVSNCTTSSVRTPITVTVLVSPVIAVNSGTICAGKSFTLVPSGASSYTFPGGSSVVTPTATTLYYVTGTGTNGCLNTITSGSSNIVVNSLPTITVSSNNVCLGSSYTIVPGGASTYTFMGGGPVVSPTANSSYSITGTSSQGCVSSNTAVANLSVAALPTIAASGTTICEGDSYSIVPTGASTYSYSGGLSLVNPTVTTNYSVTGTSSLGCQSSNTAVVTVSVNPKPLLSLSGSNVICGGNTTTLSASGASTYTWNNTSSGANYVLTSTISTITSTITNTVTGTSAAGCNNSAAMVVTVNAVPLVSVNSGSICAGKNFSINPTGASTYTISGGTNLVSPAQTTVFTVVGTNTLGCVSSNTASSNVTVVPLPTLSISGPTSICTGNTATITASGAASYTWTAINTTSSAISNASLISVSPTVNTIYSLIGRTAGCRDSSGLSLAVFALPSVSITSQASICIGSSGTLTANGASTYTWSNASNANSIVVSPTVATTYTLIGTGTNGCTKSAVKTIGVNPLPTLTVTGNTGLCQGSSTALQVTGIITCTWSNGLNSSFVSLSPTVTTTYTISGSNSFGCVNSVVRTVTVYNQPVITASVTSPTICVGNTVAIGGQGASTYTWFGGIGNNTAFSPTITNIYSVTATDANGCVGQGTVAVAVNPLPVVSGTTNILSICSGNSATLSAMGAVTYSWSNGSAGTLIVVSPSITTIYTVTGTDANGCSNKANVKQLVSPCLGLDQQNSHIELSLYPNPTNGKITLALPLGQLENYTRYQVFNTIGELIINANITESETLIDLGTHSKGLYIVRIYSGKTFVNKRIVKD
ncbi:MAG: T9SS type A sorting domain-containing protein [Bacteroidia bacterium]|nr:T9SS type A sorting domain-containing protein [Bacteroidia bacterium]